MFPSITKRLFIIKEIDTASECSNMAALGKPILYKLMLLEMIIMTSVTDLQNVSKSSLGIT
jgi:hypothetical protein